MNKGRDAPLRVLICDDDPHDRWLIQAHLQQQANREFTFVRARQTSEIQSAFDQGTVDLVLMDMNMADKSSWYWLRQIVENHLAPVVVLNGGEETAAQSLQQGAVGYLPQNSLLSGQIIETIDCAMKKWKAMKRGIARQDELKRLANVDSLTGLLNRRATLWKLKESITRARRYGEKLCVLLLDIDNFKQINDTNGHTAGDDALRKVATLLQRSLRDVDIVGRYGGDEFLIILPYTDLACARCPAERIRKAIQTLHLKDKKGNVYNITASFGAVEYKAGNDCTSIIDRVDIRLYEAKQKGRNRVQA